MKKQNYKKEFLNLIGLDFMERFFVSRDWEKLHKAGINRDFTFNGSELTFPEFCVEIANIHGGEKNKPSFFTFKPNVAQKFAGQRTTQITSYLNEDGHPMGYIEYLNEKGERDSKYSQFFGILGKHTMFFEDKAPHNGKRVCTIIKLGTEPSVLTNIKENHEAYQRVILPAIEEIENLLTFNCIDHAPVAEENVDEM